MTEQTLKQRSQALAQLPHKLYTAEQVRALDNCAINELGIPGIRLMRRAGDAAFHLLRSMWPDVGSVSVFCGGGNNGGDGYILAGLACRAGLAVQLVQLAASDALTGDAKSACDWAKQEGVVFTPWVDDLALEGEVIVDALLGTGFSGEMRVPFCSAVKQINADEKPVLAIDIPSGLNADTGVAVEAIHAAATVTFIGCKQGLLTGQGPELAGALYFHDLNVPQETYNEVKHTSQRIDWQSLKQQIKPRKRVAHKGDFGRVLVVGGNLGMGGAAIMAAEAAARVGAGLVTVATRPEHVPAMMARRPEVMCHGITSGQDFEPLIESADVIVVGPGLGQAAWSEQVLRAVLEADVPLVVDADALNIIAEGRLGDLYRDNWILTPHPGEAARLLQQASASIQADRFAAARSLQQRYGGVAVLKGAGTLVADADTLNLCTGGNPGMATGGMGDVLSGVLAGLVAQKLELPVAAQVGVALHAAAGDVAAEQGERGLLATDLFAPLRALVNE